MHFSQLFADLFLRSSTKRVQTLKRRARFVRGVERLEERTVLTGYFLVTGGGNVTEPTNPEQPAYVSFTIGADNPSGATASVDWEAVATGGDTATAGVDFEDLSGTLTVGPNQQGGTIQIPVLFD